MSRSGPRVSVGLPVFNGERYLEQAVISILEQTFPDFELIISDNGSTDGTAEICRAFADRDSRVRVTYGEENLGAAANFNRVFRLARGGYFKWAAHDDWIKPDFLLRCVEALDRDPAAVLCFPWTLVVDGEGREVACCPVELGFESSRPRERLRTALYGRHRCFPVFGLVRSDVLRRTPLIGPYVSSDRVLLAWLALAGSFRVVPEYLFVSRSHAAQSVHLRSDLDTYAAWYDPARAGRPIRYHWRLLREHVRAVGEADLRPGERARCYALVGRRFLGRWRALAGEALGSTQPEAHLRSLRPIFWLWATKIPRPRGLLHDE